jgi:hypothetical protein
MGGNALKNVETRRLSRDEYFALEAKVVGQLRKDFPGHRVEAVRAYRQKDSFGDMDVLFESTGLTTNMTEYVKNVFSSKEVFKNGGVTSFECEGFQVDLLFTPTEEYETSVNYFAWNDLGNLMGRVAHKMGFKYGHDGLKMVFRDGDYQFAEVVVTRNVEQMVKFLGYDYDRLLAGFDTLEEMFAFAASTPFFNKDMYLLENRNHTSRMRDRKRKSYNSFLQWVDTAPDLPAYPWADMKEKGGPKYKQEFVKRAREFFPEFGEVYDKTMADFETWKQVKETFNGNLVREWTGLENQELGNFMKHLRETQMLVMGKEAWDSMVLSAGQEGMKKWVMPHFEAFMKGKEQQ